MCRRPGLLRVGLCIRQSTSGAFAWQRSADAERVGSALGGASPVCLRTVEEALPQHPCMVLRVDKYDQKGCRIMYYTYYRIIPYNTACIIWWYKVHKYNVGTKYKSFRTRMPFDSLTETLSASSVSLMPGSCVLMLSWFGLLSSALPLVQCAVSRVPIRR